MSLLDSLNPVAAVADGVQRLIGGIGSVVGKFVQDPNQAGELNAAIEQYAHEKWTAEEASFQRVIEAKEHVMIAELQQGDPYTKRTRPLILRRGFYMIMCAYGWMIAVRPLLVSFGMDIPEPPDLAIALFEKFVYTWSALTGTYILGRGAEKVGAGGKIISMITGSK